MNPPGQEQECALYLVVSQKVVNGKVRKPKLEPCFAMSTLSLFKWRHFLPEILLNVQMPLSPELP